MRADQSIYFFTLHKCASSLFASYVLKNVSGFRNVNYAKQIYGGTEFGIPQFNAYGHVYGPIRVSAPETGLVFQNFIQHCLGQEFLADKKLVCLIRDPRDILVSWYYSEGWTHTFSRNAEIRVQQERRRSLVQSMSVDEYARQKAPSVRIHLERLLRVMSFGQSVALLRYEDMICRQVEFAKQIKAAMPVSDAVVEEIFRRSQPQEHENITSHQRSGKTEQFKTVFDASTRHFLDQTLGDCLSAFGYDHGTA